MPKLLRGRPNHRRIDFQRGGRSVRPTLESLEGRVVLATSLLDPTFGQGGALLGPVAPSGPIELSHAAVTMQPDGKIVTIGNGPSPDSDSPLLVSRYNADGSVDTTFGTNGQVAIPAPTGSTGGALTPHDVAIEPTGKITFAVSYGPVYSSTGATVIDPSRSQIVQVTSSGQLDSTFAQNGEFLINLPDAIFENIAVQADGRVVAAGLSTAPNTPLNMRDTQISVIRLTPTGTLDPTFNGTGILATLPGSLTNWSANVDGVAITPSGQILVSGDGQNMGVYAHLLVERLLTNGALDASFGSGGIVTINQTYSSTGYNYNAAFPSDGTIVLPAGQNFPTNGEAHRGFIRLLPNGTIDPSFRPFAQPPAGSMPAEYDSLETFTVGSDGAIILGGVDSSQHLLLLERYLPNGTVDRGFGTNGRLTLAVPSTIIPAKLADGGLSVNGVVITPAGQIVVAGDQYGGHIIPNGSDNGGPLQVIDSSQSFLTRLISPLPSTPTKPPAPGNYDGGGKTDVAAYLPALGLFAYRKSGGGGDVLQSFGPAALGGTIPAPGDYDGDGKADVAAYLPALGAFAIRPSSGGPDRIIPFGIPGAGQSIPAPGDYDGDGKTDLAVYLPALGIMAYRPSNGGADVLTRFGIPGAAQSIPAPGDYDGMGKTDVAVYLPALGILAYRPSNGGADVLTRFGIPGAAQSIPAPGDYDGDGTTDVAVYLPALGDFAYRPSGGGSDVVEQFGIPGAGQSIPAPGDYDGDGKTDFAVYLPALGDFAYRPSSGGSDVVEQFGIPGTGQTVPASSIPYAQPASASPGGVAAQSVAVNIPLTDEVVSSTFTMMTKRKHHGGRA